VSIKVTEKGQPFRISTGFDMSGSSALSIKFTAPSAGTDFTKTNSTTPAVSAPAVALTNDPELGTVPASEYFEYTTDGTEFDVDGDWKACGVYTDASLILEADEVTFAIGASCA